MPSAILISPYGAGPSRRPARSVTLTERLPASCDRSAPCRRPHPTRLSEPGSSYVPRPPGGQSIGPPGFLLPSSHRPDHVAARKSVGGVDFSLCWAKFEPLERRGSVCITAF